MSAGRTHARLCGIPLGTGKRTGHAGKTRCSELSRKRRVRERGVRTGPSDVSTGRRLRQAVGSFAPPRSRAVAAFTSGPSPPLVKPSRGHPLHLEQPDRQRNRVARERERKAVRSCAFPPLSRSRRRKNAF